MPVHSAFLKYFDEVCKSGSIRKAASKLFVASSAVNRQILKIEDELNIRLFDRSHEGIKLTPAGQLLAQHVSRTIADAERTLQAIEACRNSSIKGITIAGQESVISRFLPPTLIALHTAFPDVATSFRAASGRRLNELLINGSADIALAFDAEHHPDLENIVSVRLPVGAVMSPHHPLAGSARVTLLDCSASALILPDASWPLRDILDRGLLKIGIDPESITTSNSVEFMRTMLREESVIGFQTIIGIEPAVEEGSLVHIPLYDDGTEVTQEFSVCAHRERPPSEVLDSVLQLFRERLQDLPFTVS